MTYFIDEILCRESNQTLLSYKFEAEDIHMWPLIRFKILEKAMEKMLNVQPIYLQPSGRSLFERIRYLENVLRRGSPRANDKLYEILIFSGGSSNFMINGKYRDRVNGYFAQMLPETTLVVEDIFKNTVFLPKEFKNTLFHDHFIMRAKLLSKLRKPSKSDNQSIGAFIEYISELFPEVDVQTRQLAKRELENMACKLSILRGVYFDLFERYKPRLMFIEDGSYGDRSYIIKWAKEAGIKTAEFQHGFAGSSHISYNYGVTGFSTEYKKYLPDFLLCYGGYWADQIKHPAKPIIIGNPHLAEMRRSFQRHKQSKSIVLVATSGGDYRNTNKVVGELIELLNNDEYQIILRPHPQEAQAAYERYGVLFEKGIEPDIMSKGYGNLIAALENADYFVVEAGSTAAYEAAYFDVPVILIENGSTKEYIRDNMFTIARNGRDIYEFIRASNNQEQVDKEYIFCSGWQQNYLNFVKDILHDSNN